MNTRVTHVCTLLVVGALGFAPAVAGTPQLGTDSAMLQHGASTEDALALVRRGDALAKGEAGPRDFVAALSLYRRAAALGHPKGLLRLGEAMVLGRGTALDPEAGLMLIEEAAAGGDGSAYLLLGEFYARGLGGWGERRRAVAAYERAAELERPVALIKLGDIYRDGLLVPRDTAKAAAYYRQAVAAGRRDALVPLGKGLAERKLGHQGSPAEGIATLRQAQAQGIAGAAAAYADCYLKGRGVPKNTRRALDILSAAMASGDIGAGRRLVALYRDGRKNGLPRNLPKAGSYLKAIEARLDPGNLQIERVLLQAAAASRRQDFDSVAADLRALPSGERFRAARQLRGVNPNLYVHVVQGLLKDLGYYNGQPTGQLSRGTVRAIARFCLARDTREVCTKGPMTPGVTDMLAAAF